MEVGLFPAWSLVFAVAFGAAIGSFLNVVIYRMPRTLSLSDPKHSFCPKCEHRLEVPDLFPLLSYLALRGKCRHCGARVSPRYFIVELLNAALWTAIWYQHLVVGSDPGVAIAYSAAASILLAIVFIDLEHYIIPDQLNAFLWLVGILYNVWLYVQGSPDATTWGIPSSLAGWIVGVAILWGIALFGRLAFGKDAMGHGDIKMARGIGAVVFPVASVMSFAIAVALGAVLGALQVLYRRLRPGVSPQKVLYIQVPRFLRGPERELLAKLRRANTDDAKTILRSIASNAQSEDFGDQSLRGLKWPISLIVRRGIAAFRSELNAALETGLDIWPITEEIQDIRVPEFINHQIVDKLNEAELAANSREWTQAERIVGEAEDVLKVLTDEAVRAVGNMSRQQAAAKILSEVRSALRARNRFTIFPLESIGSLLKCGLGYLLCLDIVGLFLPKLYEAWFGEPAFAASEEEEEFEVERTMIPFGPYLAMGALGVLLFRDQMMGLWGTYVNWAFPPERGMGVESFTHLVHFFAVNLEQASTKESLNVVESALGAII